MSGTVMELEQGEMDLLIWYDNIFLKDAYIGILEKGSGLLWWGDCTLPDAFFPVLLQVKCP